MSIVKLNIGGVKMETTKETLIKSPYFMERLKVKEDEYFVDRYSQHFHYILNYLRGQKYYMPENHMKHIENEANFYGVFEGMFLNNPEYNYKQLILESMNNYNNKIKVQLETILRKIKKIMANEIINQEIYKVGCFELNGMGNKLRKDAVIHYLSQELNYPKRYMNLIYTKGWFLEINLNVSRL